MSEQPLDPRVRAALQALEEVPPRNRQRAAQGRAVFLAEAARLKAEYQRQTKNRLFGFLPVSLDLLRRLKGHTIPILWQEVHAMPMIAIIILAVAVFTGGTAATVYAADQAVPGEPLYALDVTVEQLRLRLAGDPATQAELHLQFAQERLAEIQELAQQGNTEAIAQAAANLQEHLTAAQQALEQVGSPDIAQQMQQVAQQAESTLAQLPVPVQVNVPVVAASPTPDPTTTPAPTATPDPSATPEPSPEPQHTGKVEFVGVVESMDGDTWIIDGQTVLVTYAEIEGFIQVGDTVKVEAYLQADGTLMADEIKLHGTYADGDATPPAGQKVEFVGTVESMDGDTWIIDGQTVLVTYAEIKDPIQVGDMVKVEAYLQADGTLMADEIKWASDYRDDSSDDSSGSYTKVEFVGTVESMDGDTWIIDGQIIVVTGAEIKGAIQVGDTVKVEAYLQADGTLLADEIERYDMDDEDGSSDDDMDEDSDHDGDYDDDDDSGSSDDQSGSSSDSGSSDSDSGSGGSSDDGGSGSDDGGSSDDDGSHDDHDDDDDDDDDDD